MKLRTKLTLITVGIVICAVLLSTFLIISFTKKNTQNTIIAAGTKDFCAFYDSFSNIVIYSRLGQDDVLSYSYLRYCFLSIPGNNEFIFQQDDTIISNNTGISILKVLAFHNAYITNTSETIYPLQYTFYSTGKQDFLLMSTPITFAGQEYALSLVRDITETLDNIDALGLKCIIAGLVVILNAALLVLLLVRHTLKPLSELENGASKIANGYYESRIIVKGSDEIAIVAEQFNRMAIAISDKIATLHETAQRQQAFINDLSHELKTPVASIMARSETLLRRKVTQEDMSHSLERIYHQCAWLERLSSKLTVLVMLQGKIEKKPENVAALLASVEETVSESLNASRITLHIDCRTESLVMDFDLLRSALVNLVENARKASMAGQTIEIHTYDNIIEVTDHGSGIPPEELARVTEPFYMVDHSRSKKKGGSGLGLVLVKRIAEAHGAKLQISSVLGAGTTCRIVFVPVDVDK